VVLLVYEMVGPGDLCICDCTHFVLDAVDAVDAIRIPIVTGNVMRFLRREIMNVRHHLVQSGIAHLSHPRWEAAPNPTVAQNVKKVLKRVGFRLRTVKEELDSEFELLRLVITSDRRDIHERTSSSP
jgi:hypothetical protein